MKWIFLSPHLDDVVFSCGALVWELVQAGNQVEVWTICAGGAPEIELSSFARSLHTTWQVEGDVVQHRREEDTLACQELGALVKHFKIPDCIYRRSTRDGEWLYPGEEAIFGGLSPLEKPLIEKVSRQLSQALVKDEILVSPLGIGNHVDHELTRKAAHRLKRDLRFYADYPYVREPQNQSILKVMSESEDWKEIQYKMSPSSLAAWKRASALYRSQIKLFWEGEGELRQELEEFTALMSGVKLWKKNGGR